MQREMTLSKCLFFYVEFFYAYHILRDAAGNDVEQVPPLIKARRLPLCLRGLGSRHGVEHVALREGLDRAEVLHGTGIPDFCSSKVSVLLYILQKVSMYVMPFGECWQGKTNYSKVGVLLYFLHNATMYNDF